VTTSSPTLADLICTYVNDRALPYKVSITDTGPTFQSVGIDIPMLGVKEYFWHLGVVGRDNRLYMTLPNKKSISIDVFCEDSLDVIYRLIRLDVAKRLRKRREFFQSCPMSFINRKMFMKFIND
jgi:hypothetical protein